MILLIFIVQFILIPRREIVKDRGGNAVDKAGEREYNSFVKHFS